MCVASIQRFARAETSTCQRWADWQRVQVGEKRYPVSVCGAAITRSIERHRGRPPRLLAVADNRPHSRATSTVIGNGSNVDSIAPSRSVRIARSSSSLATSTPKWSSAIEATVIVISSPAFARRSTSPTLLRSSFRGMVAIEAWSQNCYHGVSGLELHHARRGHIRGDFSATTRCAAHSARWRMDPQQTFGQIRNRWLDKSAAYAIASCTSTDNRLTDRKLGETSSGRGGGDG